MTAIFRAQCVAALLAVCTLYGAAEVAFTAPAQASEYYTRKRVNGVWITGKFKRKAALASATNSVKTSDPIVALPAPVSPVRADAPALVNAPSADPPSPDDYMLRLRKGLEARALAMVTGAAPSPRVVAHVVFDYLRRTKITTYSDGVRSEEILDPVTTGSVSAVAPQ